jgi:hypothetical protein
MRLKFFIPTAGYTCLTAATAEVTASPREKRSSKLLRIGEHRNASRKQTRELDALDDDQLQLDLFNLSVATPSPNAPTKRPTIKPVSVTQPSSRIKIYWQSGYNWQGEDDDPFYCMGTFFLCCECEVIQMMCTDSNSNLSSECSSRRDCNVGDIIRIEDCDETARDQQFTAVGLTVRPAIDPTLCFTIMGYGPGEDTDGKTITTPIQLQLCEENDRNQQFVGFQSGGKFELSPLENQDRCLGQLHHPKRYEKIYPRICTYGRRDDTSNWITY